MGVTLRSVVVLMVASVSLTACGDEGGGTASEEFLIGYPAVLEANPNNVAVVDGLKAQAEELGMRVATTTMTDPTQAVAQQTSGIETLIQQGVDALVLWPSDPQAIRPALDRAREAGIIIVTQDSPTGDAGPVETNVQSENYEASYEGAEYIVSEVGEGVGVVAIEGLPFVPVLQQRNDGFLDGARDAGLNVLAHQVNEKDTADGARPLVDAWRTRYGDEIEAIWTYNDPSALGAASAKTDDWAPLITGMNGSQEGVDAVLSGAIDATWDFRPVEIGNVLGWAAYEALTGGELPPQINVEMIRYDSTNIDEFVPVADRLEQAIDVQLEEREGKTYFVAS
jgi:ribose transport system substrate-binding protein